jgi:hypothetical protein
MLLVGAMVGSVVGCIASVGAIVGSVVGCVISVGAIVGAVVGVAAGVQATSAMLKIASTEIYCQILFFINPPNILCSNYNCERLVHISQNKKQSDFRCTITSCLLY